MKSARGEKRQSSPLSDTRPAVEKKKRETIPIACDTCRLKKVKCDGRRPICTFCDKRSQRCQYRSGTSRSALKEEIQTLRDETTSLREQLGRARSDPATGSTLVFSSSRTYLPKRVQIALQQAAPASNISTAGSLSFHQTNRAILPFTESLLEYELMSKHPNLFPVLEPYESHEFIANSLLSLDTSSTKISTTHVGGLTANHLQPKALCDDRLRKLEISYWTTVDVSNDVAASIISEYLVNQHPVLGIFDAHLFVGDLVDQKLRFCSPFLVNAVLYFGCQAYTVFDSNAAQLSWSFYNEAKKLWQADDDTDSLLNIAALVNMAYAGAGNGHDKEGLQFLNFARRIAGRLGLDDGSTDANSSPLGQDASIEDDLRFRSHVFWGYFVIVNAYAFYYQIPPTPAAPLLPMPGSLGFELPSYMGFSFRSVCEIWRICREIVILYAGAIDSIPARVPLAAMESKLQKLLALDRSLEIEPLQDDLRPHHTMILHIWYHATILTLIRPWIAQSITLKSFDTIGPSPDKIYSASLRQLKRLMTDFRMFYPQARNNVQWLPSLLFIANAALASADKDPEWQFYFMAALYGYAVLSPAYRIAELCFQGLLALAVETGKMSVGRAKNVSRNLSERLEKRQPSTNAYSGLRINLDGADLKGRSGTAEALASRFEALETNDVDEDEDALEHADAHPDPDADAYDDDALFQELANLDGD